LHWTSKKRKSIPTRVVSGDLKSIEHRLQRSSCKMPIGKMHAPHLPHGSIIIRRISAAQLKFHSQSWCSIMLYMM